MRRGMWTASGGIVAEYRIVESWKGPKAGTCVRLHKWTNFWGGQFPDFVVRQSLPFVTGHRSHLPSENFVHTSSWGGVPLCGGGLFPAITFCPIGSGSTPAWRTARSSSPAARTHSICCR